MGTQKNEDDDDTKGKGTSPERTASPTSASWRRRFQKEKLKDTKKTAEINKHPQASDRWDDTPAASEATTTYPNKEKRTTSDPVPSDTVDSNFYI